MSAIDNQRIPVLNDIISSTDEIEIPAVKLSKADTNPSDISPADIAETTAIFDDTLSPALQPDKPQKVLVAEVDIEAISEQIIEQLMPDIEQCLRQRLQTVLHRKITADD